MSTPDKAPTLGPGQRAVSAVAVVLGLLLAAYGAVGSYGTIRDLAWRKELPLPELVPVGIDGGLFGLMLLEIVLTWTGQPLVWLRQLVRLLTIGTIATNAVAGWPDPIAVGLHIAAPVMLLAMLEAARAVLLRRIGIATGTARDRIPSARWVLAPWRTWLLWRRMVLWQITHYHTALDMEMQLCHATALLRAQYGRRWKRKAPADLVWKLRNGVAVDETCDRVHRLAEAHDVQGDIPDAGTAEPTDSNDPLLDSARKVINNGRARGIRIGRGRLVRWP